MDGLSLDHHVVGDVEGRLGLHGFHFHGLGLRCGALAVLSVESHLVGTVGGEGGGRVHGVHHGSVGSLYVPGECGSLNGCGGVDKGVMLSGADVALGYGEVHGRHLWGGDEHGGCLLGLFTPEAGCLQTDGLCAGLGEEDNGVDGSAEARLAGACEGPLAAGCVDGTLVEDMEGLSHDGHAVTGEVCPRVQFQRVGADAILAVFGFEGLVIRCGDARV